MRLDRNFAGETMVICQHRGPLYWTMHFFAPRGAMMPARIGRDICTTFTLLGVKFYYFTGETL